MSSWSEPVVAASRPHGCSPAAAPASRLARPGAEIANAASLADDGIELEVGGHGADKLRAADLIVLSPGVSPRVPDIAAARRRGVPVISEVELAARWLRGRLVAVTGTKGKSTTVVVTGRMLEAGGRRAVVGGNIGVALSSQVEDSTPDVVHVVEVSSFQLELTETFRPWIAVCLNLSPDHLDRHASFEEYAGAKARLFANQTPDDAMVINADDPQVLRIARAGRARALRFAVETPLAEGVQVTGDGIARRSTDGDECLVPMSAVRVPGRHLLSDIAAAAAVGTLAGIDARAMTRAVQSFTGLEHTLELVGEIAGVRFVNDSKANQHRRGAGGDRVLRAGSGGDSGRPVQGGAVPGSASGARVARCVGGRHRRSAVGGCAARSSRTSR